MRFWLHRWLGWVVLVWCFPSAAQVSQAASHEIRYVSKEAVYIDAGRNHGVVAEDTLTIMRNGEMIALVVVEHLAGQSCAGRAIRSLLEIRTGDNVLLPRRATANGRAVDSGARSRRNKRRRRNAEDSNVVRGYVSLQSQWLSASTGARLAHVQPAVNSRLQVQNLAGAGWDFRLRQHSRFYERSISGDYPGWVNEWQHRVFELALVHDRPGSVWTVGVGRMYSPQFRGVGYLDGVHVARKLGAGIEMGVAAGKEPELENTAFDGGRNKLGAFVTVAGGSLERTKWTATLALSGSYEHGAVNREFLHLQNSLWLAQRVSIFQSAELDLNRDWRRQPAGAALTLSNFFLTANWQLSRGLSTWISYDNRRQVRTLDNSATPDSMFDATMRDGVNAGAHLNLPANVRVGASVSARLHEAGGRNTLASSFFCHLQHFPARAHSVSARLSYFDSDFSSGYRPALTYRWPVTARWVVNVGGGGYFYQTGALRTESYYVEMQSFYTFLRRFSITAHFRRFLDVSLRSSQLFVEASMQL